MTILVLAALLLQAPAIADAEADAFAREIEKGLLEDRAAAFDEAIDLDALLGVSVRGLDLKLRELTDLRAGLAESFAMGKILSPTSGNSYRYLGIRKLGAHRGPLFRLWSPGGINYHALRLKRNAAGRLRIEDLFIFLTGDWMSAIFRRGALTIVSADPARKAKLDAKDAALASSYADFQKLQTMSGRDTDPKEVLAAFQELPKEAQSDRLVQTFRLLAATKVGEKEYLAAEEEFRKLFPDDFSIDLVALDGFVYRKEYEKAIQAVDRLDKQVGGDPILNVHRANMRILQGKRPEARGLAAQAAKDVSYIQEPRWLLVTIALSDKDHAETIRQLEGLEKDFKLTTSGFEEIADYADFVKSEEYRAWMKKRAGK